MTLANMLALGRSAAGRVMPQRRMPSLGADRRVSGQRDAEGTRRSQDDNNPASQSGQVMPNAEKRNGKLTGFWCWDSEHPLALFKFAQGINDTGQIVGYFGGGR
jgi:hypothetical protein